jgi:hypothetical protein
VFKGICITKHRFLPSPSIPLIPGPEGCGGYLVLRRQHVTVRHPVGKNSLHVENVDRLYSLPPWDRLVLPQNIPLAPVSRSTIHHPPSRPRCPCSPPVSILSGVYSSAHSLIGQSALESSYFCAISCASRCLYGSSPPAILYPTWLS